MINTIRIWISQCLMYLYVMPYDLYQKKKKILKENVANSLLKI